MAIFGKKTAQQDGAKEGQSPAPAGQVTKTASVFKSPQILVQPRISEKAGHLVNLHKYVFMVKKAANKIEVKKAVELAYKVKVVRVNIVNMKGKHRNYGRSSGLTSDFKKAIVTLKKGDKIEGLTDVV